MSKVIGERLAPDAHGQSDWGDIKSGLDEMIPGELVYVEGQGWLYPEDAKKAH